MMNLSDVRQAYFQRIEVLRDRFAPFGCFRAGDRKRPDLYSSIDVAIARTIMGEDLKSTLTAEQRAEWIGHINSFADDFRKDGSYSDTYGHSPLHGNYMGTASLSTLGGKQKYPVQLYQPFDAPEKVDHWLEQFDWSNQWRASHQFWGGMFFYSFSRACPANWLERVFTWLNANIDPQTGWWRKGQAHADRHQALGGGSHFYPLYQHHSVPFPLPERVIDSMLAMQLPDSRWFANGGIHVMSYLELDALYTLNYMMSQAPGYRKNEIITSVRRYGRLAEAYWRSTKDDLLRLHPHVITAAIGTFGLLQQILPDEFVDNVPWSDIFSDSRFIRTAEVEVFSEKLN